MNWPILTRTMSPMTVATIVRLLWPASEVKSVLKRLAACLSNNMDKVAKDLWLTRNIAVCSLSPHTRRRLLARPLHSPG